MRPLALLLPALALVGCCCERPCAPRCDPCARPATMALPAAAADPMRVSVGAGLRVKVPESTAPLPMDVAAPSKLTVYDVRDLVASAGGNETLLADLKPVLPPDAQAFTQGEATIVVKTTAAGQDAADRWLGDRRRAVTPVMVAHAVFDLTATTPIDALMEALRAALPAGTQVNQQGTGTLIIKATPAVQQSAQRWLEDRRSAATPPK